VTTEPRNKTHKAEAVNSDFLKHNSLERKDVRSSQAQSLNQNSFDLENTQKNYKNII